MGKKTSAKKTGVKKTGVKKTGMSYGMTAVAGLALHDRAFFDLLLKNPKKAIESRAAELGFNTALQKKVLALIEDARLRGQNNPVDLWEHYKLSPPHMLIDWPTAWPRTAGR